MAYVGYRSAKRLAGLEKNEERRLWLSRSSPSVVSTQTSPLSPPRSCPILHTPTCPTLIQSPRTKGFIEGRSLVPRLECKETEKRRFESCSVSCRTHEPFTPTNRTRKSDLTLNRPFLHPRKLCFLVSVRSCFSDLLTSCSQPPWTPPLLFSSKCSFFYSGLVHPRSLVPLPTAPTRTRPSGPNLYQ